MRLPVTARATPEALLVLAVAGYLAPAAAVVLLTRAVEVLLRSLAAAGPTLDPLLGLAACVMSSLLLGWWVLGVSIATWSQLAPRACRVHALALRLSPPLARRTVVTLLGTALAVGAAAPVAALERPRPHLDPSARSDLAGWSADRPAAPVAVSTPEAGGRDSLVVVRTGDTLWDIAAHALGPGAGPGSVDRAWRRWYAVNRAVVGPDPDLLRPGLHLRAPDPYGRPR